ncbi:MAG TPA: NAD(P)H-binding protein [Phototrophicaceae bacterium]|jgi:uncharacterized protein YbjT (DUF2867 family)|nr:NAD(P)H-binding protein [Phototrophicaceae bacterium]
MVTVTTNRRVLVTGGGTFLGDQIALALLAEGADVTLLVRPGAENNLGELARHTRWWTADIWDAASLRGRARNHICVVNTIGSMNADPVQGLSYHRLNFVSARNIVNMCVSDGVPHLILMSSVRAPWVNPQYISAKREAEEYVRRVGMSATIIRAPLVYARGQSRPLFFQMLSALGSIPPFSWTRLRRIAPMPIDVLARGVARVALESAAKRSEKPIYYASDLRRLNTREEARRGVIRLPSQDAPKIQPVSAMQVTDDDAPFGWTPPRG